MNTKHVNGYRRYWLVLSLLIGVLTPSAIIVSLDVFASKVPVIIAIENELKDKAGYGFGGILLFYGFTLIPFVALIIISSKYLKGRPNALCLFIFISGMIGILIVMIPGHISVVAPLYWGGHMSSTAALGYIVIPFYCLFSMSFGMMIGWLIWKYIYLYFKNSNI